MAAVIIYLGYIHAVFDEPRQIRRPVAERATASDRDSQYQQRLQRKRWSYSTDVRNGPSIQEFGCVGHYSIRSGHHLDFWPLTLRTFSAMPTHVINMPSFI